MQITRSVFVPMQRPGALTWSMAQYTRAAGVDMVRRTTSMTRSDTLDDCTIAFSNDNGVTWSDPTSFATHEPHPRGTLRRHPRAGVVDAVADRYIWLVTEGVLPNDSPLEGMKQWSLRYHVSSDGGCTWDISEPLVQRGHTIEHPLDGVWIGRNGVMIGDKTCVPIRTRGGNILVPLQVSPVGPDGEYFNPGGGYTYHDSAVAIGSWTGDGRLAWDLSQYVKHDPAKSTRGCVEPTITQFADGRILMVMRGSNGGKNDPQHALPGYRWCSVSEDEGRTWSPVRAWTYEDGTPFFSPSSCSQLLTHSSGRVFWLGNISPTNPRANGPRYPMVIGEVDPGTLLLKRSSIATIDDRAPHEPANLILSNFHAREDRVTHEIVLHMSRLFAAGERDWGSDAYAYRIRV